MSKRLIVFALGALALLVTAAPAHAQLNSSEVTATLTATLPESLTVTLTPAAASFTLTSGSASNPGSVTLSAVTTWSLALSRTSLSLYGYFSNASAALVHTISGGTVDIPSAKVEVNVNGAGLVPFNQTVAFGAAAAGRTLVTQAISAANASGTRTDTLALNIDLSALTLPADTYTGTLRVRAQATP